MTHVNIVVKAYNALQADGGLPLRHIAHQISQDDSCDKRESLTAPVVLLMSFLQKLDARMSGP